ncbi:hypothetical protein [uncultured Modestobacter sp.]|uniref:hypothetical protein n=1 Tax=uncultured Modestobacter sp. TaxID=380048 RepID=UPI002623D464|nr:hypothetical protein [uncultured Modestobacter sp.]
MSVPPSSPLHAATFSRRSLLAAALAGTALLAAGCTDSPGDAADAVTPAQVDQLAAAVAVQEQLVSAYDRALGADPALAGTVTVLADQARTQLERLRAAAPGAAASTTAGSSAALDPAGVRGWLRTQVSTAAAAHAAAAPDFTGGRAALLGSIAAGLRGQEAVLA